jgi:peptidyl-prolyl cis-trans isomerase A (cyclophilin A)
MLAITNLSPIPDAVVAPGAAPSTVTLAGRYDNQQLNGTITRFATDLGDINVMMYDQANPGVTRTTPLTVANFLQYLNQGRYSQTIIHRSVSSFIIQGGGFTRPTIDGDPPTSITSNPAVVNEPGNTNVRGTIAMAKVGGNPDSATSQWFFNLGNNAANLDNQNGGFTVFGRVIKGLDVMDAIAALQVWNFGDVFAELPLRDHTQDLPVSTTQYVGMNISTIAELGFSAQSSNPALVTPTIVDGALTLTYGAGLVGSAEITVRVTCADGSTLDDVFTVRVNAAPVVGGMTAAPTTVDVDAPFTLTVATATDDAGVARIDFYRDANGDGTLDTAVDPLAGSDTGSADGWRVSLTTGGLALGTHRFFARATDVDGAVSNAISTTITVIDIPPPVLTLAATPGSAIRGSTVTLTATELALPDLVGFRSIEFYADTNRDGAFQPSGADRRVGASSRFGAGVSVTTSTRGLAAGEQVYFARVLGTNGVWYGPAQTSTIIINNAPTVRSLAASRPVVANVGDAFTIQARGIADVDGSIASVRYYRESTAGGGGSFDSTSDILLGTVTGSAVNRPYAVATGSLATGVHRFYAVAVDNEGATSTASSVTARVNAAPTIATFTASPTSGLRRSTTFNLSAGGVADTDGTVRSVQFHVDVNGNGVLDSRDRSLVSGKLAGSVWTARLRPGQLPLGTMSLFAVATDNDGGRSVVSSFRVSVA